MRHTGGVAKPWWLDLRGCPPSYQRRVIKPLSRSRVLFFRIFFPAYLVTMLGLAIAGFIWFGIWWMAFLIMYPLLQWALLSPLHRSQILGRGHMSLRPEEELPPEEEREERQRAW